MPQTNIRVDAEMLVQDDQGQTKISSNTHQPPKCSKLKCSPDKVLLCIVLSVLTQIRYEQVLTVKECATDDEDGMLSYGPHELITVIDK